MRPDDDVRIPLDQIGSMHIEDRNLVVKKKRRRSEPSPEMRRTRTNRWWNANMPMDLMAKVEIWVHDEAAKMDVEAGGTNETLSHYWSESSAEDAIISKLRSTKGHLRDIDLIERATLDLHRIEIQKGQPEGTFTPFVYRFIDMLGIARDYSEKRVERLKSAFRSQQAA